MKPLILDEIWFERLKASPSSGEAWAGFTPEQFSKLLDPPPEVIPSVWGKHLTRKELHRLCRDPQVPALSAYVAVMAWGQQGRGHPQTAWAHSKDLQARINRLRTEELCPREAFGLFLEDGKIAGLGPSYFTKVLHFFAKRPMWIMDLWTSLSINLLFGERIVPVYNESIHTSVRPHHYQRFCMAVEIVARRLECSPDEAEMRMFDGSNENPLSWRNQLCCHYGIRTERLR